MSEDAREIKTWLAGSTPTRIRDKVDALATRAEAAEAKNAELSKLIVEQEAEYRERKKAAEAALARGDELLSQAGRALEAAEAELARVSKEYADWKEAWNKREVACEAAEAEADRLRQLVIEAYDGDFDFPSNGWRKRAEDLDAWPGAALAPADRPRNTAGDMGAG